MSREATSSSNFLAIDPVQWINCTRELPPLNKPVLAICYRTLREGSSFQAVLMLTKLRWGDGAVWAYPTTPCPAGMEKANVLAWSFLPSIPERYIQHAESQY